MSQKGEYNGAIGQEGSIPPLRPIVNLKRRNKMPRNDSRCRLSIELPFRLHNKLNELLAGWRIKNRLFRALTEEIVELLGKMDAHQRRVFIVAVLEKRIELNEWSGIVKEGTNESKGVEKKT